MNTFKLDTYSTRGNRLKALHKPNDVFSSKWFILMVVAGAFFVDTYTLTTLFNKVCTPENIIVIYTYSVAIAFALDVPLAVAGNELKRYKEGLSSRFSCILTMTLSITLFISAFVCAFLFRMEGRELAFEEQGMHLVNTIGATPNNVQSDSNIVLIAAILAGICPLLTSGASFAIAYYGYHPLNDRIKAIKKELITLDANTNVAKGALAELQSQEEHCKTLLVKELDLYEEQLLIIGSKAEELKQKARVLLMEKLGTPESISSLTESSKHSIEKVNLEASEDKLVDNLFDKLNTSDEENY